MFRRRRDRAPEGIHEPNMTPLIDVSLVLVVILMVATPMALQSAIAVSRAGSSGRDAAPARTDRVEVEILDEATVRVNRTTVARAALGPVMRAHIHASPTRRVVVRCADGVSHGAFVAVLDDARLNGALQIAVEER